MAGMGRARSVRARWVRRRVADPEEHRAANYAAGWGDALANWPGPMWVRATRTVIRPAYWHRLHLGWRWPNVVRL